MIIEYQIILLNDQNVIRTCSYETVNEALVEYKKLIKQRRSKEKIKICYLYYDDVNGDYFLEEMEAKL